MRLLAEAARMDPILGEVEQRCPTMRASSGVSSAVIVCSPSWARWQDAQEKGVRADCVGAERPGQRGGLGARTGRDCGA
ncbi:hypothetical protein NDU88_004168 [Pleurodeles waltl]|uniref:Uncharacterized protein n=1 Tax=Pleurodeles waltl TaxID=8319 RepID=A0AAV7W900_PLEWA|nr:hypothetical protein NDU88_004168 [Pleurodeles waltl]